ncbi:DUF2970 domain-containing protein [Candidatus Aalborgicola defluviihabitans]|jgi:hypothetical protein|uniref:DUF2970 domain-containing protein n=1 Tax=Candidatus Aalborgicola defluviihabitans TaxID=3386187 RepID=UPI001ED48B11|nr:DUF2970 domain-containing protein [Burkholderiales bacterium]MBK7280015.1 DUF2970 domain-containing protein [Burkholderiales bacterium]MBL0243080.1 DUF2970 domain-containing protein [Rhodoferax sp.]
MTAPVDKVVVPASGSTSAWRSVKLVAWSFFGIRGKAAYQEDLAKVNPMHVVAAGLLGILLLVVSLIGLVNWIVAK